MAQRSKVQGINIAFDLVQRMHKLRAKLSTEEKRVKLKELIEQALNEYLEKKENE